MQLGLTTLSRVCSAAVLDCMLFVLCVVFGRKKKHQVPVNERQKNDDISVVRAYKKRLLVLKPGKSSYPLPPEKNFERPPRASECTDRAET